MIPIIFNYDFIFFKINKICKARGWNSFLFKYVDTSVYINYHLLILNQKRFLRFVDK
mgnify:CR=1